MAPRSVRHRRERKQEYLELRRKLEDLKKKLKEHEKKKKKAKDIYFRMDVDCDIRNLEASPDFFVAVINDDGASEDCKTSKSVQRVIDNLNELVNDIYADHDYLVQVLLNSDDDGMVETLDFVITAQIEPLEKMLRERKEMANGSWTFFVKHAPEHCGAERVTMDELKKKASYFEPYDDWD